MGQVLVVVVENRQACAGGLNDVFFRVFAAEDHGGGEPGLRGGIGEMHNWRGDLGLGGDGLLRCRCARKQEEPSAKPQQTDKPRKGEMQSHLPSRIVGCEVTRVNPEAGRASCARRDTRREHARIFVAALRIFSREINFVSPVAATLLLLRSFSLPFLFACALLRIAVEWFYKPRLGVTSNRDLPARFGCLTEGRLDDRAYCFPESCAPRPPKPRGTQL